jgi:hypothetical protein
VKELQELFGMSEAQLEIANIFHSYSLERVVTAVKDNTRFVHYTNAETAMKLFSNREVWLRKSTNMNDYMEVDHGFNCLSSAYRKHKGDFEKNFEQIFPGICKRIEDYFDSWLPTFRLGTYLTCVSEHDDDPVRNEDRMGRLSMWRAYGGAAGVAIVMNSKAFHTPITSDALKAYVSPVAYLDIDGFEKQFLGLVGRIIANRELLQSLGEERFFAEVSHAFRYATLCTKHPGFFEEREWRIIYSPAFSKSQIIIENIESIGGVPQNVCKLPLKDHTDLGINGIELPKLINRVIIGPTPYPFDISEALIHLLDKAGVENAASKVFVSDIPLRQPR